MTKVAFAWFVSLVVVAMATFAVAQSRFPEPRIVSGNDIGFRVEGTDLSGRPMGTLMVRVNGQWNEVGASMTVRPVK